MYEVKHFHLYLFGAHLRVITDHRPLTGIVNNRKPTRARLERWHLHLTPSSIDLIYRPGRDENNLLTTSADTPMKYPDMIMQEKHILLTLWKMQDPNPSL